MQPTSHSFAFSEGAEEAVRAEFVKVGKQLAAEALQKLAHSHPGNDFFLGLPKP